METNNASKFSTFAENISKGLKVAQQEIEELALQFSLGKADATEKFEEIKKEFNTLTNEWKQGYAKVKSLSTEGAAKLKAKFAELQLQLALGKAEANDLFEEQRKKILNSLHELEVEIKNNPELNEHLDDFKTEIEKFKLKLDILKLKFELKKIMVREDFKSEMSEARKKVDDFFEKARDKWENTKVKNTDFRDEIDLAYKHFKKAISKLQG